MRTPNMADPGPLFNRHVAFPLFPPNNTFLIGDRARGVETTIQLMFPDGVVEIGPDASALKTPPRRELPLAVRIPASERTGDILNDVRRRKSIR